MPETNSTARLQAIGLTPAMMERWRASAARGQPMRVVEVQRAALVLHDGEGAIVARPLAALLHRLEAVADAIAVGDWVLAERDDWGGWLVHERLAPATQLARRMHDGRDKVTRSVLVSNVDCALLVMGLDGDWNLRRLERYAALVRLAGIDGVVVLTKLDVVPDAARRIAETEGAVRAGTPVVALDARGPQPAQRLAPWLAPGRTLVLLGSSGVGKSTLTNALAGEPLQATGGQRHGDGRGRHTTTARSLHVLPGGACLIDTPGLRTLRLDVDPAQIGSVFDDVAALAPACRFRDCRHAGEPGCAVRDAVPPERLSNFHKLLREARRDEMSALERRDQVSQWKSRTRAARARMEAKRG